MWAKGLTSSPLVPITPMKRAPSLTASSAVILIALTASLVIPTVSLTRSIPLESISGSMRETLRWETNPTAGESPTSSAFVI